MPCHSAIIAGRAVATIEPSKPAMTLESIKARIERFSCILFNFSLFYIKIKIQNAVVDTLKSTCYIIAS